MRLREQKKGSAESSQRLETKEDIFRPKIGAEKSEKERESLHSNGTGLKRKLSESGDKKRWTCLASQVVKDAFLPPRLGMKMLSVRP